MNKDKDKLIAALRAKVKRLKKQVKELESRPQMITNVCPTWPPQPQSDPPWLPSPWWWQAPPPTRTWAERYTTNTGEGWTQ